MVSSSVSPHPGFVAPVTGDADADDTPLPIRRMLTAYYDQSLPPELTAPPVPTVDALAPTSIVVDTPTPVTVTGTGFKSATEVVVDGVMQLTQYVDATTLRYVAEASAVGTQTITAITRGVASSNSQVLTVTATGGAGRASTAPEPAPEPEPQPAEPDNGDDDDPPPTTARRRRT
jgi:hypothetical protein